MSDVMHDDVEEPVDFEVLWTTVQKALQLYAGASWTERGEHDPGITLLQALTFNVADLSFRQSFPLVDLLTPSPTAPSSEGDFSTQRRIRNEDMSPGIFAPEFGRENALTCGPVTYDDYRKAILDLVVDIKGKKRFCFRDVQILREDAAQPIASSPDIRYRYAYIEKPPAPKGKAGANVVDPHSTFRFVLNKKDSVAKNTMVVSGGYRLWLACAPGVTQAQAKLVLDEFLRTNRNLCEVFSQIDYLTDIPVIFKLTIEVEDDVVDFATLLAQIYQACSTVLLTPIERRSAAQRLKSEAVSDVFVGPQLRHGWIKSLAPTVMGGDRFTLSLAPLQVAIEGIAGVNHVASINATLSLSDNKDIKSELILETLRLPVPWAELSAEVKSLAELLCQVVVLRKRGRVIETSSAVSQVEAALKALVDPFEALPEEYINPVSYGQYREPGQYAGVSSLLPAVYGTNADAASLSEDAKELLRFLLPLDQCLANEMDLLRKLPWLLSFDRRDPQAQSRGGSWPLFAAGSLPSEQISAVLTEDQRKRLKHLVARGAKAGDKELELLDYLLRFFGESRSKRVSVTKTATKTEPTLGAAQENEFLNVQQGYLGAISKIAYKRASIQIDMVSALQQRLAARFGVGATLFAAHPNFNQLPFYVLEHRQLLPIIPSEKLLTQGWKGVIHAQAVERSDKKPGFLYLAVEEGGDLQAGQLIQLRKGISRPIVANVIHSSWASEEPVVPIDKKDEDTLPPTAWVTEQKQKRATIVSIDLAQHDRLKWNAQGLTDDFKNGNQLWQWKSSEVWLKRVVQHLAFEGDWPKKSTTTAILKVTQSFPLEWRDRGKLPECILLRDRRIWNVLERAIERPLPDIELLVSKDDVDPLLGTIKVSLKSGHTWPECDQKLNYGWVADYTNDVFSFTLSIVLPRWWLEASNADRYATDQWVQDVIRETVPAHIVTHVHWLGGSDFQNFSKCYAEWQLAGRPAGDRSYTLLQYLSIGELPVDHRTGIGFVRVASKERSDALAVALNNVATNAEREPIADQTQVVYVRGTPSPAVPPPKY